jgi:hypothetical protein
MGQHTAEGDQDKYAMQTPTGTLTQISYRFHLSTLRR